MEDKKKSYDKEYKRLNYDKCFFLVKKGKREEYQQAAEDFGLGQAEMYRLAIEKFIAERSYQDFTPPIKPVATESRLTAEQRKILDAWEQLPESSRKILMKLIEEMRTLSTDKYDKK